MKIVPLEPTEEICRVPKKTLLRWRQWVGIEVDPYLAAAPAHPSQQREGLVEKLDIPYFRRTGMLIDDRTAEITQSIHQCRACGCFWRLWKNDLGWSLADAHQKSCKRCDNSPEFVSLLVPPAALTPPAPQEGETKLLQLLQSTVRALCEDGKLFQDRQFKRLPKYLKTRIELVWATAKLQPISELNAALNARDHLTSPHHTANRDQESVERDAMRYRYLRKVYYWGADVGDEAIAEVHADASAKLDAAIDEAMGGERTCQD